MNVFVGSATVPDGGDGFPDATNTGVPAGTSLTTVNADVTLSTPGQVYEDKLVNGTIDVSAANVTIRRCKIVPPTALDVTAISSNSTGLLVEDCEIVLSGRKMTGIGSANYTARRCNIYGGENLISADSDVTLEDSYLHDPVPYDPVPDPHTDCVEMAEFDPVRITLNHNTLLGGFDFPELSGPGSGSFGSGVVKVGHDAVDITITNNKMGGAGYSLQLQKPGESTGTNIVVTGNRGTVEACAAAGYPTIYAGYAIEDGYRAAADTWSDNTYLDGPLAGTAW